MIQTIVTNWHLRPEGGNSQRQRFAIGDVHGHADLLEGLLDHIDTIERVGQHREIIFTGDLIDRGPDSVRAASLAIDAKKRCDQRIILPGNHESYLLEAIADPVSNMRFWAYAGGLQVMRECVPRSSWGDLDRLFNDPEKSELSDIEPEDEDFVRGVMGAVEDTLPPGFLEYMRKSYGHYEADNLFFVHAGMPPLTRRAEILSSNLLDGARAWGRYHWSLIRRDFLDLEAGWDIDDDGKPYPGPTLVIHGHTPAMAGPARRPAELRAAADHVANKRRINIDLGVYSNRTLACVEFYGRLYRLHCACEVQP